MAIDTSDRRVRRTRRALLSAFAELVLEHGYDTLSIGDVIARADVGRSTFYEHFRGKEDILRQSLAGLFAVLADMAGSGRPTAALVPTLAHFWENRRLGRALLTGPTRRLMARWLAEPIGDRLAHPAPGYDPVIPRSVVALQLAEAQLTLIGSWLDGKAACRVEAMAETLTALTDAAAAALLRAKPTAA